MFDHHDYQFMAEALRLAEQGLFSTTPNPRVGCVIVTPDHKIAGRGWHQQAGGPHAEIFALQQAGADSQGATAYITLEPCSHHGKTGPCSQALIQAGISRVVVAMPDPNPLVAGNGLKQLQQHGIRIASGLMADSARQLNQGFISRMTRQLPWVTTKIAMSLDGRTALANGISQWITGPDARQDVQYWRARSCAVITGINTVLADNPQLNVRTLSTSRQPLRVILDSQLRIPANAAILQSTPALIFTASEDQQKIQALRSDTVEVCSLPDAKQQVDLKAMLQNLAQRGCNEVLIEAGEQLNGALLQADLIDQLILYMAPQLMGDAARSIACLGDIQTLEQTISMNWEDIRQVGKDLRIITRVNHQTDS